MTLALKPAESSRPGCALQGRWQPCAPRALRQAGSLQGLAVTETSGCLAPHAAACGAAARSLPPWLLDAPRLAVAEGIVRAQSDVQRSLSQCHTTIYSLTVSTARA